MGFRGLNPEVQKPPPVHRPCPLSSGGMLIDGQKWACEACIRGHRVTSCKHHDRPLIRIKRKGRPLALCTMCNATPCTAPIEHARVKREAELQSPKKASSGRLFPRHNSNGFLPIAPRPGPSPGSGPMNEAAGVGGKSRSGSRSGYLSVSPRRSVSSASSGKTPGWQVGAGDWSGSERSTPVKESGQAASLSVPRVHGAGQALSVEQDSPGSRSAPGSLCEYSVGSHAAAAALFDPGYSLLPSTSAGEDAQLAQTLPMLGSFEGVDPFEFPMDLNDGMGYLGDADLCMDREVPVEMFHVEDWSRYIWSAETGFEHLDTEFPPVSQ